MIAMVIVVSLVIMTVACAGRSAGHGSSEGSADPRGRDDEIPEAEPPAVWSSTSEAARYRVSIAPLSGKVELGRLQAWRARFETLDGRSFQPAQVVFSGGMPQHGHGFDTSPRATGILADGAVQIDGVRFHMAGAWRLRIDLVGPEGPDTAWFEVVVEH